MSLFPSTRCKLMVELLVHTTLSDGTQSPSEAMRAARNTGCRALVISDHADASNLERNIRAVSRLKESALHMGVDLVVGVELTHVPAALLADIILRARRLGAEFVAVHGEGLYGAGDLDKAGAVERGTNLAALLGGADLLVHPGLIRDEEAFLAAERGILLTLSTHPVHGLANGHVAQKALAAGAGLALCANPHNPAGFITQEQRLYIAKAAGLDNAQAQRATATPGLLLSRLYQKHVPC